MLNFIVYNESLPQCHPKRIGAMTLWDMTPFEWGYSILMMIVFALIFILFWAEHKLKVPAVPLMPWLRIKAITLAAKHSNTDAPYKIADLGSGWGGLCFALARHYKKSDVYGFELSPLPFFIARVRAFFSSLIFRRHVSFKQQDIFKIDISDYDIIFCYLSPFILKDMKEQFLSMKKGAMIITCSFPIEGLEPDEVQSMKFIFNMPVHFYRIK
jgi:hypothetical protein